jgi:hypothetical protein
MHAASDKLHLRSRVEARGACGHIDQSWQTSHKGVPRYCSVLLSPVYGRCHSEESLRFHSPDVAQGIQIKLQKHNFHNRDMLGVFEVTGGDKVVSARPADDVYDVVIGQSQGAQQA